MPYTIKQARSSDFYKNVQDSDEQKAQFARFEARMWRDGELNRTDKFVTVTDHPDHTAIMAYRVALRNWPATNDFPDTKPTIGS